MKTVLNTFILILSILLTNLAYANLSFSYDQGYQWYSTPTNGYDCNLITGRGYNGAIIAGGSSNNTIKYFVDFGNPVWQSIASPGMGVSYLSGNNSTGPIVASGVTVKYMDSYSANTWNTLSAAPFSIQGLTGDNKNGPVIFNGKYISYMSKYSTNQWATLYNKPFPWGNIAGISGDNKNGVVAFSDEPNSRVAYLNSYSGSWVLLPRPKNGKIIHIAGNNQSGPIVKYDTGEIYSMNSYSYQIWHLDYWPPYKTIDPTAPISGENGSVQLSCTNLVY